jgi:hypothetical protein
MMTGAQGHDSNSATAPVSGEARINDMQEQSELGEQLSQFGGKGQGKGGASTPPPTCGFFCQLRNSKNNLRLLKENADSLIRNAIAKFRFDLAQDQLTSGDNACNQLY